MSVRSSDDSTILVVAVTVSDTRNADSDGARAVFEAELKTVAVRHIIVKDDAGAIVELCRGKNAVLLVRFQTDYFARMRASLRWGDLAERETLQ